ncbi:MAG: DVU0298 family protein [Desulfohalobiaceae bacterium]
MSEQDIQHKSGRQLKSHLYLTLSLENWEQELQRLSQVPARRLISPLFGTLCASSDLLRWRGISSLGQVVSRLIQEQGLEAARVVLRRLTWSLNDESGGIGWGAPEALGEIQACSQQLALEYHRILLSFINPGYEPGNFLEYTPLRRGAYWGLARLAQANPELFAACKPTFMSCLAQEDQDGYILACAALFMGSLQPEAEELQELQSRLRPLAGTQLRFYWNRQLCSLTLLQIAGPPLGLEAAEP